MTGLSKTWPQFLKSETLFDNAIRLRYLFWTINRYARPGDRLLEVGFGSGMMALLLADQGYRVVALDINPELVARFQNRSRDWLRKGQLEVLQGNMFGLPWQGREFDLAYHQGVLEHFADEKIVWALQEQGRVARRIIFDVPNHRYGARPFGDERLLTIRHWKKLIAEAGLALDSIVGRAFPHWLYVLPYALFARRGFDRLPGFGRMFSVSTIFICRARDLE